MVIARALMAAALVGTAAASVVAAAAAAPFVPFTPKTTEPEKPVLLATHGASALYSVSARGYDDPILLGDFHGATRYDLGVSYGVLLGNQSLTNYQALMAYVSPNALVQDVLTWFLDVQYNDHLVHGLPSDMRDEIRGIGDGGASVGVANLALYIARGLTLASIATGDVISDIKWLIIDELFPPKTGGVPLPGALSADAARLRAAMVAQNASPADIEFWLRRDSGQLLTQHCSMFGVFGARTVGGALFSGRNLDWEAQTGIAKYKLLSVYHIAGAPVPAYVTVGFAGLIGALTGMSSAGLTVHEAGNDNDLESLDGFAWSMRLRYVMEQARDLTDARALWAATNNTLGLNHGIGSSADRDFLCLETRAGYTAYFGANDPREANTTAGGVPIGAPLPDAVWRTNHGYDPEFLSTVSFPLKAHSNSVVRYYLIRDTIAMYQAQGVAMNLTHALNVTAVVGDKDNEQFTNCSVGSSNIVSVAYHPAAHAMAVAWETGRAEAHLGAGCNSYVLMDMSGWFDGSMRAALEGTADNAADERDADAETDANAAADFMPAFKV